MADTFCFPMEASSSYSGSTMKQLHKPRRATRVVETPGPELGDVFLGVTEMASLEDVMASQRSERDERGLGRSSGQSNRSRGSKSSGGGAKKPQASISKKDALIGKQTLGGEELSLRESTTLARQQLTSSASRVRPSKQQNHQPLQPQQSTRGLRPTTRQVTQAHNMPRDASSTSGRSLVGGNNNNEDEDEPIVEEEGTMAARRVYRAGVPSHHQRGLSEWEVLYGVNQAGQLPSRIHRYLNFSAGSDGHTDEFPLPQQDEEDSPLSEIHGDRPPSRQRHAFPTHLLDARDFFSPAKPHEGATAISITPWHADEDEDESASKTNATPEEEPNLTKQPKSDVRQRPPSRYMTKAPRGDTSSSSASSTASDESHVSSCSGSRLPSRRGAAGQWNQAAQYHHDPKTDGFADLDERVPPPFRVEITTESARSQYVPSDHRRADEERRHSLRSRRSSSFGTRAQLNKQQQAQVIYGIMDQEAGLRERGPSKRMSSTRQSKFPCEPEWLATEQESNPVAHNPTIRDHGANRIDNNSSSAATASSSTSAAHQWFRASNNPFFLTPAAAPVASEFDEMDVDTAIANTPLFAGEGDLMAMTQLSDLHLDDFMGDPYVLAAPPVLRTGSTASGVATVTEPDAKKLNTSLGKDFLSLFAQH